MSICNLRRACRLTRANLLLCRKRGKSIRKSIDLEIMHGITVFEEERVGHCIVQSSSGRGHFDPSG